MFVNFNILNQLGSPAINSNTFANRPAAGQTGRLFVSTDTFEIYRDNGTSWDLIGGPGTSTITGTGTANYITKFTGAQSIGNSIMTEGTGLITITGTDPRFVVGGTDDTSSQLQTYSNVNTRWKFQVSSNTATDDADITGYRTRGTVAAPTAILAGDSITNYSGRGYDGTNFLGGAGIDIFAEENYTPAAAGTYLILQTTSIGAITESEKVRLTANGFFGIGTNTPLGLLHVDGGASAARMILDADSGVAKIFSFRTDALPRWAFRVDGAETGSNAGADFALRSYDDTGALLITPLSVTRANGKASWQATQTYSTGLARANYFDYNLSVAAGASFSSPNAITALGASLDLTLAGNATIPSGARTGLDAYNSVSFTGAGTLTMTQGTQIRPYSNITAGWAFNGSATGTITHLAGLRVLFPDNSGSAVSVTNNYGLLINDQTANTGTVTYTNRWGIYQEGASDLNYLNANLLLGSTTNNGNKLQVTGNGNITGNFGAGTTSPQAKIHALLNGNFSGGLTGTTIIGQNSSAGNSSYLTLIGAFDSFAGIVFTDESTAYKGRIVYDNNTEFMAFWTDGAERMRITSGGNLAIGTTSAGARLQVNTSDFTSSIFNTTQNTNYVNLINSGGQSYIFGTGNDIGFATSSSVTERMRITSGGNVLIGTTTDAGYKLYNSSNTLLQNTVLESRNGTATSNDNCFIFTTNGQSGGIRPSEGQHLFLQSRSSANRDIGFITGSTPLERYTIKGTGQCRFVPLAADPAGAQAGDVYYNSGTNKLRLYDGTNWVDLN